MKNKATYVLMVAKVFSQAHPRAGEPTNFKELIADGVKIHTIRNNYKLWAKRIDKIRRGEAILSLRQWEGKPYNSKQVEIFRFEGEDVGYEMVKFMYPLKIPNGMVVTFGWKDLICIPEDEFVKLASNDGLSRSDFFCWFSNGEPGTMPCRIIIHFTKFRYQS